MFYNAFIFIRIILALTLSTVQIFAFTFQKDVVFDEIIIGITKEEFAHILKNNDFDSIEKKANLGDPKFQFIAFFTRVHSKALLEPKGPIRAFLIKSAKNGFIDAQALLGSGYYDGEFFPKDLDLAYKWLSIASEKNHPLADYYMGKMYSEGVIVDKDIRKAFEYFNKSSKNGFSFSDFGLALLYYRCNEILELDREESLKKALSLLQKSKKRGIKESKKYINLISYDLEKIYKKKAKTSFEQLTSKTNNNNPSDQLDLGMRYLLGSGTSYNLGKAIDFFILSADQGLLEAQEILALLYLTIGDSNLKDELRYTYNIFKKDRYNSITKNNHKSLITHKHILRKWYEKALVNRSGLISTIKAESLITGRNQLIEKNIDNGIILMKQLADAENTAIYANERLYEIYSEGVIVEKNISLANSFKIQLLHKQYFEVAPNWGKQFIANYVNTKGKYLRLNLGKEILKHSQNYADLGMPDAIAFLGMLYDSGILGWKTTSKSIALLNYSVAYNLGFNNEFIAKRINLLKNSLSEENLLECEHKIDILVKAYQDR